MTRRIAFWDTETFCETPLRDGTARYAEEAEIMLHQWAIGDGPVNVWDVTEGGPMPAELHDILTDRKTILVVHGSFFDRTVGAENGITIVPERIHDTMVQALSHGLPGGLDKLCDIFQIPVGQAKDKRGKQLVRLFCMPRPKNSALRRATRLTHPVEWRIFVHEYAPSDIVSMRLLYQRMPRWNYPTREHALWCLDQKINDRGFKVDLDLASAAIETVERSKKGKDAATGDLTSGEVRSTTQRDQLLRHLLESWGVDLPDMQKGTLERRVNDENLPWPVRELIAIRLQVSSTSNAKYNALLKAVSSNGRLRGSLQFCGAARTKRWSGKVFQPQNLPRPDMKPDDIAIGIDAMKAGSAHLLYDEPIHLASNAIRGCIVAAEGRKLVVSDLEQVEARTLPWLASEQWKLDDFAAYDRGEGWDLYTMTAARLLNKHPSEVTKAERQAYGKVVELACFGPHTRVLTNNGVKPITEVTTADKLWDGEEWATHQGLVNRGPRLTIRVDGVEVTTDHEILSEIGWQPAWLVASCPSILQSCQARGSANLPWSEMREDPKAVFALSLFAAPAAPRPIELPITICYEGPPGGVMSVPNASLRQPIRHGESILSSCRTTSIGAVFATVSQPALTAATIQKIAASTITAGAAFTSGRSGAKIVASSLPIWSRWKAGMIRCLNWIDATWTKAMSPVTFASSRAGETCSTDALSEAYSSGSLNWSSVYDIAHAGPRNRFTVLSDSGALIVHNCGYGGAAGAFAQFAALYGVELPEHEVYEIIRNWRAAHPKLCDWDSGLWARLDAAARQAIGTPNRLFMAGEHIGFERWRNWLKMHLPSGGFLSYASPAIVEDPRRAGSTAVSYMGINNYTRRWERSYTFGGKLSADATQATAREVLAHNLPAIEEAGYPIVLLVHDEVVTEPLDQSDYSVQNLNQLLSNNPPWAKGLPLAAGGFEDYRYRKDG